jgi:hypothetical protein
LGWEEGRETYGELGVYFVQRISRNSTRDIELVVSLHGKDASRSALVDWSSDG